MKNLRLRFQNVLDLIRYLEKEAGYTVVKIVNDTKVVTDCGLEITIRGEVSNADQGKLRR